MGQVHTLYFIHHSHTDVGYTHDQPIVWDLQMRFLDEALDLAEQYADRNTDGAFRWTVESAYALQRWLQRAPARQVDRLIALERAGRVEVTGMYANVTPLYDIDQLVETFQVLRALREDFGFTIRHAMNCDVNGENWPLVDLLLDLGIEGFTMAINTHFGGAPLERPNAFWWQGPSGRSILAWNGWTYDTGWRYGIGRDAAEFEHTWWPRVERRLDEINYPLPVLMVQSFHPFGDNGSAYGEFSRFIDAWNEQGKSPRLRMATPREWWAAVKEHGNVLPTHRGDWTDYWNFGCISSAREQATNRASRTRLRSADAVAAALLGQSDAAPPSRTAQSFARDREEAWNALHLWDEHTWGADCSIRAPYGEDTAAQWHHKAGYAYNARSLSLLLQRDALAELARRVARPRPDDPSAGSGQDLLLFNPLPWPRQIGGEIPGQVASPRGDPADATSGRHFQDRMPLEDKLRGEAGLTQDASEKRLWLKPVEVPAFGYRVVSRLDVVDNDAPMALGDEAVVENARYRLTFDRQRGGILSWYDKQLAREWIDRGSGYAFNGFVHERVANAAHAWPRNLMFEMAWKSDLVERPRGWKPGRPVERIQAGEVLDHRVYRTPLGYEIEQVLRASGCAGLLRQRVFLPDFADHIECVSWWEMGLDAHPEATYILYPFDLPGATVRLDLGGQAMVPGTDQLPGVCRDYFTAQQWVDFSNHEAGVTIAVSENPMVQFGGFHFGDNQSEFVLERAMLLGWVTNNYWETNFRAHQPGRVRARYRILPHAGGFDEARAHRFGMDASYDRLLLQHLGEPAVMGATLPAAGALLQLPQSYLSDSPVLTLHVKPAARSPGLAVRLLNASDAQQPAQIGSGLLRILSATMCDLLEKPVSDLEVQEGGVSLVLPARRVTTVLLTTMLAASAS